MTLLGRLLEPVAGRLVLEGLLLTVGRLVMGRLELPAVLGRDMLPVVAMLLRPPLGKARLIEPP